MPGGKLWCKAPGCTNQSQGGGRCRRHGHVGKRCSAPGCDNLSQNNGVCLRHGATKKRCEVDGCTNHSKQGGLCYRHGAKRRPRTCKFEGCLKTAQKLGMCCSHGGGGGGRVQKPCSVDGCRNISLVKGLCTRHGAPRRKCGASGCTKNAVQGGLCKSHGARPSVNKKCSAAECTNKAVKGGVCVRHGAKVAAKKNCSVTGCTRKAMYGGVCRSHGNLICRAEGCNYQAISVGVRLCARHRKGKNAKICKSTGCMNYAVDGGTCCNDHGPGGAETKRKRDVARRKEPSVPGPELGASPAKRRRCSEKKGRELEPEIHPPTAGRRCRRQVLPAEEVEHAPKRRGKRPRSMVRSGSEAEAEDWTARKRTHPAAGRPQKLAPGDSPKLRRSARVRDSAAATKKNNDEGTSDGIDVECSSNEFEGSERTACNDKAPPIISSMRGHTEPERASEHFVASPSSADATISPETSVSVILSRSSRGIVCSKVSSRAYDSEEEEELGAQIYRSSVTARSIRNGAVGHQR